MYILPGLNEVEPSSETWMFELRWSPVGGTVWEDCGLFERWSPAGESNPHKKKKKRHRDTVHDKLSASVPGEDNNC